jgi:hypothetical protein
VSTASVAMSTSHGVLPPRPAATARLTT